MTSFNSGAQPQNRAPQSIGFLLLDNFTLISLASAVEPLRMANQLSGRELYRWTTLSVDGNQVWAGFGIGRMQMPMAAQAVLLGGNVRVGLEDNLWLDKGVLATNGQLVERASEILSRLGARVMTPAEGRVKMGLTKRG
jgi:uncharacterized protein (DUF849 family)